MGEVLPYLGIEPIYNEQEQAKINVGTPSITGLSITDASVKVQRQSLTIKTIGSGDKVVAQFPTAGMSVAKGSVIVAYTENTSSVMVSVPDLKGKSAQTVQSTLNSAGLNLKETGASSSNRNAKAINQSVNPGDKVPIGTVITVTYTDTSLVD